VLQVERKDYTFRRQFNEKPSIIPGCPVVLQVFLRQRLRKSPTTLEASSLVLDLTIQISKTVASTFDQVSRLTLFCACIFV